MPKRYLIIIMVLFLGAHYALAKPARPGLQMVYQPDGTGFLAELRGDEFGHITISSQGNALVQGSDGFYDYAYFDADGSILNSGVHYGQLNAPSDVVRASLSIPFDKIGKRSDLRRKSMPVEGMNHIQRLNAMRGSIQTMSGSQRKHGLVILVNYQDVQFRYGKQDMEDLLSKPGYSVSGAKGSAVDYFNAQFSGKYEFDFDVFGPVTISRDRAYYGGNDKDGSDKNPQEMIVEACVLADPDVDFSLYDDDGDGEVDNVFVFYAGGDESEYAGEDCVWAHAWYIKSGAGIELSLDGKVINRYACASELKTNDSGKSYTITTIGTFCHEYSHTLGLKDLYDTDYEKSGGTSKALWKSTSLMDHGNYNDGGKCPPYYNALEREMLGIGVAKSFTSGRGTLGRIDRTGEFYRLDGDVEGEYYLFECRGNDGWDAYIGGKGMLVYHVDKSTNNTGHSDVYDIDVTAAERWWYNEVNANPNHPCMELIPADPLASNVDREVKKVFYPYGAYDNLTKDGKTPIVFWSGQKAGLNITGITLDGDGVSFYVSGSGDIDEPAKFDHIISQEVFQDAAVIRFCADQTGAGTAFVEWNASGNEPAVIKVEEYASNEYALILEELTPSVSYTAKVWFETPFAKGEAHTIKFMTASRSDSSYPFIYLKNTDRNQDGSFVKGCELPLRVYNQGKDADGVLWYFDGSPVKIGKDGHWKPQTSGTLTAEIIYKSGKRNKVSKKINLTDKR